MSLPHSYISKTEFLAYQSCPGYAWHARYRPELLSPPSDTTQRKMRDGQRVEALARHLFPDGITPGRGKMEDLAARTATLIADGAETIFQATAIAETGLLARADVLQRVDDGWHLIEIKSSSTDPGSTNTVVKKYLDDITFQTLAFRQAGIPVVHSSLIALNRTFRRTGEIDPHLLFTQIDMTEDVERNSAALHVIIEDATATLLNDRDAAACECHRKTRTNRCELFSYFHPEVPDKDTIYNIASIQRSALLPALDRGVLMIVDWPDDLKLSAKQQQQVAISRSRTEVVEHDSLAEFLTLLQSPLWYLDYESFQNAIPPWDGYAPHQQILFQYSLHYWEPGFDEPIHCEYLAEDATADPTEALLTHMAANLGDSGSVVVWNKSFEHGRNIEMAERYPRFAEFLHDVNARMIDLAEPAKNGWWQHPEFQGSWSLKQVLPVAAPSLSYKELAIGDGSTASERWMQVVLDSDREVADTERAEVLEALRIYCAQDTIAMHFIRTYLHGLLHTAAF